MQKVLDTPGDIGDHTNNIIEFVISNRPLYCYCQSSYNQPSLPTDPGVKTDPPNRHRTKKCSGILFMFVDAAMYSGVLCTLTGKPFLFGLPSFSMNQSFSNARMGRLSVVGHNGTVYVNSFVL